MSKIENLKPEFVNSSCNLAEKSITDWGLWKEVNEFPNDGTWQEKLLFIDNTLKSSLNPLQHRPNERMFWRTRPDLNKYRGWLLNKVLQHQLAVQSGTNDNSLIIPEDLPKLADDLYLFHKHHKTIGRRKDKNAGTLQYYKSLSALHETIEPYEAQYPLNEDDRIKAHDQFIAEHGGNGEAVKIAELKDGTEVIQVLSEDASRAYGSPRWCTAYREQQTYFDHYKDDLLIVIDPDGQRWQFHFRTNQLHDENDRTINDVGGFLSDRPDLSKILVPYWQKNAEIQLMAKRQSDYFSFYDIENYWRLALSIPVFKDHIMKEGGLLQKIFDDVDIEKNKNDLDLLIGFAELLKDDEKGQRIITPYIFGRAFDVMHDGTDDLDSYITSQYSYFYEMIMSTPNWRQCAEEKKINEKAFPMLDRTFGSFNIETGKSDKATYEDFIDFCFFVMRIPQWAEHANKQGHFARGAEQGHLDKKFDQFEQNARENKFFGYTAKEYVTNFWPTILNIPEWRDHALQGNKLGQMLDVLFQNTNPEKGKSLGHSFRRNEKNDPSKVFMFMMPVFYNRAGFREQMTPYINHALSLGKNETAHFKARGRGRRRPVRLTAEILKYAKQVKEWRQNVSIEHIKNALDDNQALVEVLKTSKGKAVTGWRKVVLNSPIIPEIFTSDQYNDYDRKPIAEVISGYKPYEDAFGQHLKI